MIGPSCRDSDRRAVFLLTLLLVPARAVSDVAVNAWTVEASWRSWFGCVVSDSSVSLYFSVQKFTEQKSGRREGKSSALLFLFLMKVLSVFSFILVLFLFLDLLFSPSVFYKQLCTIGERNFLIR